MKKTILIIIILTMSLSIIGCTANNRSNESEFDNYYKAKVQYVGNNSEVSVLINILGAGDYGDYTISLQTSTEPYGLTVIYKDFEFKKDQPVTTSYLRIKYAYYALALVDNLSYIEIKSDLTDYRLDVEEATEFLGKDIKEFGKSIEGLEELDKLISEFN